MFQWFVKLLMTTPVGPSSCSCCEGKRIRLEQMRKELVGETEPEQEPTAETPMPPAEDFNLSGCRCNDYVVKRYGVLFQDGYGQPTNYDKKD